HKPLVSYRINRQLSGWILPPLMIRAFGAHCHYPTLLSGFCCGLRHFASVVDEELGGRPRCAVLERHDADWHGTELWLNAQLLHPRRAPRKFQDRSWKDRQESPTAHEAEPHMRGIAEHGGARILEPAGAKCLCDD